MRRPADRRPASRFEASPAERKRIRRSDTRSGAERWVRRSWKREPGGWLRAASLLFGGAADLRHFLYETGVLAPVRPAIPVISVGGLTVGGSGKTPLTACIARWIAQAGGRVAVVTGGFSDERMVHRELNPDIDVCDDRLRARAVWRAAAGGAGIAVLDSGFQHRRLGVRLELLAIDPEDVRATKLRRLPAGPFRERWAEIGRADGIIVVSRRTDGSGDAGRRSEAHRLAEWLGRRTSVRAVAICRILPGELLPGNRRAREIERPRPATIVTSIMHPDRFLGQLLRMGLRPESAHVFPDHASLEAEAVDPLVSAAGEAGLVGTLKDVVKLRRTVGERTPLWYLEDRLEWGAGADELRRLALSWGRGRRHG